MEEPRWAAAGKVHRQRAILEETCKKFAKVRQRSSMKLLVVGAQHHGKSSFINHLNRVVCGQAELPDELETAPAGISENTFAVKTINIPLGSTFTFSATDTPAISTMSEGNEKVFEGLLEHHIRDGTRRHDFSKSSLLPPADAAVIIVSLPHWQSLKGEVSELLQRYARMLKHASGGKVSFPYVVALTKLDEFLSESPDGEDAEMELLEKIKKEVATSANTDKVFALVNMKEGTSSGEFTAENTAETFRLLTSLVNFAKNEDTKPAGDVTCCCMGGLAHALKYCMGGLAHALK